MAEYIKKEKLLEELRDKQLILEQNGYYDEANSFLAMREVYIDELPTIDIICCKDCKYYNKSIRLCDIGHSACDPDWFCADMRRRD